MEHCNDWLRRQQQRFQHGGTPQAHFNSNQPEPLLPSFEQEAVVRNPKSVMDNFDISFFPGNAGHKLTYGKWMTSDDTWFEVQFWQPLFTCYVLGASRPFFSVKIDLYGKFGLTVAWTKC